MKADDDRPDIDMLLAQSRELQVRAQNLLLRARASSDHLRRVLKDNDVISKYCRELSDRKPPTLE